MAVGEIKQFLAWCAILDYAILLLWFAAFVFARGAMYRLHTRWFRISEQDFDRVHYSAMATFKLAIMLLVLVPLAALCIIDR